MGYNTKHILLREVKGKRPPPADGARRKIGGRIPGAGRWGSGYLQCKTCQHPERGRIDYLLASGASLRATAVQFGIAHQNLSLHFRSHVTARFKQMCAAQHLSSFEEALKNATEANAETLDLINLLLKGHFQRWGANLEVGADERMNIHSARIANLLELRSRITLELQEPRNLVINNYLTRDAAQLVETLKGNPDAVRRIEQWYEARHDAKLIEHAEPQGSAD